MAEPQFADKFIGFVDVLGFKGMVRDSEEGRGLPLPELIDALKELGNETDRKRYEKHGPTTCPGARYIRKDLDFQLSQISDCVVVSAEVSPAGVINLVSHCWGTWRRCRRRRPARHTLGILMDTVPLDTSGLVRAGQRSEGSR